MAGRVIALTDYIRKRPQEKCDVRGGRTAHVRMLGYIDAATIDWMMALRRFLIEIWNGNWLECDYIFIYVYALLYVLEGE